MAHHTSPTEGRSGPMVPALGKHIAALDGLRGVAIIMVLFVHLMPDVLLPSRGLNWLNKVFHAGWVGVDLFFVLSGFLITGILLDAKATPGFFRNFYARRVLRIFPLYYFMLVLVYFALPATGLANWSTFQSIWDHQGWLWLYCGNFGMYFRPKEAFASDQVALLHFWSLAVEEHFYMVWPLVVYLVSPRRLPWVCLACIVGALGYRCISVAKGSPDYMLVLTPSRIDALAMGAWLAVVARQQGTARLVPLARWVAGVGVLFLAAVLVAQHGLWPTSKINATIGLTVILAVFGSLLLLTLHLPANSLAVKALEHPVLRFFGKLSYGIYVIHGIITPLLSRYISVNAIQAYTHSIPLAVLCVFVLKCGINLVLAWLSWHLFEKHFLKLKRYFEYVQPAKREHDLQPAMAHAENQLR